MLGDKTGKIHKQTRKQENKLANTQESKQKVVFARDKYRFGLDVYSFIMLKYERHTSKQDSCMNM